MRTKLKPRQIAVCAGALYCLVGTLRADDAPVALPTVSNVSLRGLQIDRTTKLTISGASFYRNPRLYSPVKITQKVTTINDSSVAIEVQVDKDVAPNVYPFRLATDDGISAPFMMGVDHCQQIPFTPSVAEFPVAMTGNLTGQDIHQIEIEACEGQTITVDVEGKRLGSQLRPILRVHSPKGRQIGWAKPSRKLHRDTSLQFTAEVAGRYRVELHDQLYKGPSPGFFRLRIGELPKHRFPYPIGVQDPRTSISRWANAASRSDLLPVLLRSTMTELTEELFQNTERQIPFGVTGRIVRKGEVDSYEFPVQPESKIRCRVWSHQIGTPLDGRLRIVDLDGRKLGEGDDHGRTLDPLADVTIPKGVTRVRAEVSDRAGQFGDDCIYRLEVTNATPPNVDVTAEVSQITIPAGQQAIVPFRIDRKGSKLPINIAATGASMLHLTECLVGASENRCLVEISSPEHTQAIFPIQFVAAAGSAATHVNIPSPNPNVSFPPNQDFVVAISKNSPVAVSWKSEPIDVSFPGGRFAGRLSIRKPDGFDVALSLITSQVAPDKKERDAKEIRLENVEADGSDYRFEVFVPGGFPTDGGRHWSYAVRADLKSKDGKQTIRSAYTRLRASTAKKALVLAIDSPAENDATIGPEAIFEISGKISRLPEIKHAVTVQLLGIPDDTGVKAEPAKVNPSNGRFTLVVNASAVNKELNLDKLNLQAKYESDDPMVRDVRSNNVGVKVRLKSAPEIKENAEPTEQNDSK